MTGGRKFWITVFGMVFTLIKPEAAEAIAAMVLAFNGANTAVSWAYASRDERIDETVTQARVGFRDEEQGFEPTP